MTIQTLTVYFSLKLYIFIYLGSHYCFGLSWTQLMSSIHTS